MPSNHLFHANTLALIDYLHGLRDAKKKATIRGAGINNIQHVWQNLDTPSIAHRVSMALFDAKSEHSDRMVPLKLFKAKRLSNKRNWQRLHVAEVLS